MQAYFTIVLAGIVLYFATSHSDTLKVYQTLNIILMFLLSFNGFAMGLITTLNGEEIVYSLNSSDKMEPLWRPGRTVSSREDKIGQMTMYTVIGSTCISLTCSVLLALNDLDPMYLMHKIIFSYGSFEPVNIIPISHWSIIILRCVVAIYTTQVVVIAPRTNMVTTMSSGYLWISLFKYFREREFDLNGINFYREMSILFYVARRAVQWFCISVLVSVFFVVVFGANAAVMGINSGNYVIGIASGVYTLLILVFVMIALDVGCSIYVESKRLLEHWHIQALVLKSTNARYMRRLVKSLRVIAIPIGNVNTVNKTFKNFYLETVLSYVINVLVIL